MLLMLTPSCTTSWARAPLYWTTLTLESLPANWEEQLCLVSSGFTGLPYTSSSQRSGVPPALTNSTETGRGDFIYRLHISLNPPKTPRGPLDLQRLASRRVVDQYLDLLVFGQPVDDGDDKVFGQGEVRGADALGAVHDEGQVQGGAFALCAHTKKKVNKDSRRAER